MDHQKFKETPYTKSVREIVDVVTTLAKEACHFGDYERAEELLRDGLYPIFFDTHQRSIKVYKDVKKLTQNKGEEIKNIAESFLARQLERIVEGKNKLLDFDNMISRTIAEIKNLDSEE